VRTHVCHTHTHMPRYIHIHNTHTHTKRIITNITNTNIGLYTLDTQMPSHHLIATYISQTHLRGSRQHRQDTALPKRGRAAPGRGAVQRHGPGPHLGIRHDDEACQDQLIHADLTWHLCGQAATQRGSRNVTRMCTSSGRRANTRGVLVTKGGLGGCSGGEARVGRWGIKNTTNLSLLLV